MDQIIVEDLRKRFLVAERGRGMWGAVLGLVHRRHRVVEALAGVSFAIARGELVGYIGPNGAGKSTTIKVLAGILVPDHGRCEVAGRVPWQRRIEHVARIGVVFGQRTQLFWDLPVVESFELLREIYRVDRWTHAKRQDELVAAFDIGSVLDVPVRQLSLGQRMRCDLAAALLHGPEILFLDEPTIGLDAPAKLAVRRFVRRLHEEREATVILTTHDMDDIEALCSRVMVIDRGRVTCDGTIDDLRAHVGGTRRMTVDLVDDKPLALAQARVVWHEGGRVILEFDPRRIAPAALIARIAEHHAIRDLFVENPPIEEIVTHLYAAHRGESGPG